MGKFLAMRNIVLYSVYLVYTVENSTLNRDSTFNGTVCLIESTE